MYYIIPLKPHDVVLKHFFLCVFVSTFLFFFCFWGAGGQSGSRNCLTGISELMPLGVAASGLEFCARSLKTPPKIQQMDVHVLTYLDKL